MQKLLWNENPTSLLLEVDTYLKEGWRIVPGTTTHVGEWYITVVKKKSDMKNEEPDK